MLPRYVKSCTGSTVLPVTTTGEGVGAQPRFWIFVLLRFAAAAVAKLAIVAQKLLQLLQQLLQQLRQCLLQQL